MDFVNADGPAQPVLFGATLDPLLVGPFEFAIIPDDRCVLRRRLEEEPVGISLEHQRAVDVFDFVFVECALAEVWNENLPDAGSAERAHGVMAASPIVERA